MGWWGFLNAAAWGPKLPSTSVCASRFFSGDQARLVYLCRHVTVLHHVIGLQGCPGGTLQEAFHLGPSGFRVSPAGYPDISQACTVS